MSKTQELIQNIKDNLDQKSASKKDEVLVMKEMLNDQDYKVGVYNYDGLCGEYCPYEDSRNMVANIIQDTTKISKQEALSLSLNYEFTKSDANTMINLSKEFINTYLDTNRKLPLGGRENSNVSLLKKEVKSGIIKRPRKTGEVDSEGKEIYEMIPVEVKGYSSISITGGCPKWVK